jgi:hypothetical protein
VELGRVGGNTAEGRDLTQRIFNALDDLGNQFER